MIVWIIPFQKYAAGDLSVIEVTFLVANLEERRGRSQRRFISTHLLLQPKLSDESCTSVVWRVSRSSRSTISSHGRKSFERIVALFFFSKLHQVRRPVAPAVLLHQTLFCDLLEFVNFGLWGKMCLRKENSPIQRNFLFSLIVTDVWARYDNSNFSMALSGWANERNTYLYMQMWEGSAWLPDFLSIGLVANTPSSLSTYQTWS